MTTLGKLFVVFNYHLSILHRAIDNVIKTLLNLKTKKVSYSKWQERFTQKSQIPIMTIENEPNVIVMPFIPNINMYDLFYHLFDITDAGECDFVKEMQQNPKELLPIAQQAIQKLYELHKRNIVWGDFIPHNLIVDKNKKVHICDPEEKRPDSISKVEQKAYDLIDFLVPITSYLVYKYQLDQTEVMQELLAPYRDLDVIDALKKVAKKNLESIRQNLFFFQMKMRISLENKKSYHSILKEILSYSPASEKNE